MQSCTNSHHHHLTITTENTMQTATRRLAQVARHIQTARPSMQLRPASTVANADLGPGGVNFHHLNPAYFLPRSAAIEPQAPGVVHRDAGGNDIERTYGQLASRVRHLAYFFKRNNLKRIAIVGPNTPAHLETMFAGTASGGIIMGLNYRLRKAEIEYMLDLGKADTVIVDEQFKDLVDPKEGRRIIIDTDDINNQDCDYKRAIAEGAKYDNGWEDLHVEEQDENSLLGLFFTSGTTGKPKGVEYTHRGVYLASLANVIESGLNGQGIFGDNRCTYLWTLPMFHAAGWTYPYAVTAVRGTHVCLRKIEPDYCWDLLENRRITHMNAAPTVNAMLLNSPKAKRLPQQVRVIVAASPPSAKLFQDMIDHNLYPVHMYGLTETYGPFTRTYFNEQWQSLPRDEHYKLLARQGTSFMTSAALRVVNDKFEDVAKNGKEIGEIVIRGNIVCKGYHENPDETMKNFNGWFRSGDLAVMHEDGNIQILDRKKDIIISGGENISSIAVESAIVRYPGVLEAAVVGVPHSLYGEVPFAFVTVRDPANPIDPNALRAWLIDQMGKYQVPKAISVVAELPKTSTGKVRKNVLRDEATKITEKIPNFEEKPSAHRVAAR